MSRRDDLDALVKRHAAVLAGEAALLEKWESDPGISIGRAARCRQVHGMVGDQADRVADVVDGIGDLPENQVITAPSRDHRDAAARNEASLRQRSQVDGPTLADALFDEALAMATDNARHCADDAETAFADCTGRERPLS